ncbi:carbamoyl phosphate synthase large subunit [Capnocytophaga sp. HP1101]
MKGENNILITSAGQRVSLLRSFQRELKAVFPEGKVYAVDMNPRFSPACQIADGYAPICRATDDNYPQALLAQCLQWGVKLIVPTIDTELLILAKNKQLFLDNGITPVVSSLEFVQQCRDKRLINIFFQERGIAIPRAIDKKHPTFPLFIKPYNGSLSKDIFLIRKAEELTSYHLENPELLFMEYIDPQAHDEYTVDTYYNRSGDLKCVVPRKRIFVRAGEINKGITKKNLLVPFVTEHLAHIEGAKGCLTMQFFLNQETKKVIGIEINPRFGGGFPLSYAAGANYPKYLIEEYLLGREIPINNDWEDHLLMLRYDEAVFVSHYEEVYYF